MKNILLLHIGISKTGTTALQIFLYENREKLEKYGWRYPDLTRELFGTKFIAQRKEINGGVFYKEIGKLDTEAENWNKAWQQILMHLKDRNVIVSEEKISLWDTNRFLIEAKKKYDNIKVVIYLRRQDRAIESMWNQKVKNGNGCSETFQEFIHSNNGVECSAYHYKGRLDEISKIVGKENLIVRIYEKEQLFGENHTTESDFLSVIGIKPNWKEWKNYSFQNLRLNNNYLELKRIFNSLQVVGGIDMTREVDISCFEYLSQIFDKGEGEKGYFALEEREYFLKQFVSENEEIARNYLHREDGKLFYDTKMNYPIYESLCTPFEEDLVRLFFVLIYNQGKKYQNLEKQSFAIAEKLILNNNLKERKLLLFGAGNKCKELLKRLSIPITYIIDNDEEKDGRKLAGIEVVSAERIKDWLQYYILITCVETEEIENQLQKQGLKKEKDYALAKEYFSCY